MTIRVAMFCLFISFAAPAAAAPILESSTHWFAQGRTRVDAAQGLKAIEQPAKNVIVFVGDGMGISTITAARILAGQRLGKRGEEHLLSFEHFPYAGLSKTYNTNQQVPDSAGTMTAMMTGVKTSSGAIGVPEGIAPNDCAAAKKQRLVSALALAEQRGLATGVVTTARLTHATPAAAYASVPNRDFEDDSQLPKGDPDCQDIAAQLIDFSYGDGIEVALGGGRQHFLPTTMPDPEQPSVTGRRLDGRNLTQAWQSKFANAAYVWNLNQLEALDVTKVSHVLGLFEPSHMHFEIDRADDRGGEPSLAQMTRVALDILQRDDDGFFLVVEGGRIDHAHHAGNAHRALTDAVAFADAVAVAAKRTREQDTLIIVTADHSHVFTMAGYPTRGNPIFGLVRTNDAHGDPEPQFANDASGKPYTTLGYANGPGYGSLGAPPSVSKQRPRLRSNEVLEANFRQESIIALPQETHGGEDVAVYARGPYAHLLQGTFEQNVIFHVIDFAAGLSEQALPEPSKGIGTKPSFEKKRQQKAVATLP